MSRRRRGRDRGADPAAPSAPPPPNETTRAWAWILLPALVAVVLYLPTLRYPFIGYDDTLLIVDNQSFLAELANLPRAFTQDAWRVPGHPSSQVYYRPLYTVSFMLDAQLSRTSPVGYHLTNIALHALASALLFAFLRKLGSPGHPALLLSVLFAVHPALTSVVAWVPGRNDSLLAVFSLACLMALADFGKDGRPRDAARHLAFLALALLTKEAALALPFIALAYLVAVRREPPGPRRVLYLAGGWCVVTLAYVAARLAFLSAGDPSQSASRLAGNLAENAGVLVHYLGKALIPVGLALLPARQDTNGALGVVALVAIVAALGLSRRARVGHVAFGACMFVFLLLPTLVVPVLVGLEQRVYLPLAGLAVVLLEVDAVRGLLPRSRGTLLVAALACVLAVQSAGRFDSYASRSAFWKSAVAASPHSSLSRMNLCAVQLDAGNLDEAERQCHAALTTNAAEPVANNNLGVIYGRRGQPAAALTFFDREVTVNPGYADAWFNRGVALSATGDPGAARKSWERALALDPRHERALRALAADSPRR